MSDHRVIIRPEAFGCGFDVLVDPPLVGEPSLDREFPTHREARGYAGGIRLTRRFPIDDRSGEGRR